MAERADNLLPRVRTTKVVIRSVASTAGLLFWRMLITTILLTRLAFSVFAAQTHSNDTSFNIGTGANGRVTRIIVLPDGKILIAGLFSSYNGTARGRVARINSDGSLDSSFASGSGANNNIWGMTRQSDGKILISGEFTSYDGTSRNRIARLNSDGTLDTTFDPGTGANATVYYIALQNDGKVIICGDFSSFGGTTRRFLARLNSGGSLDTTFDPGTGSNSGVWKTIVQPDGKILIAGQFTTFRGTSRKGIARVDSDGALDTSFNPGTGGDSVLGIDLQTDGKVVIGGFFTDFDGNAVGRLARLNTNGSFDSTFNTGTGANSAVRDISIQSDGKILVGGSFNQINGSTRGAFARLNSDGSLDTSFDPGTGANNAVFTLTKQSDGKVLLGGDFSTLSGASRSQLGRIAVMNSAPTLTSIDTLSGGVQNSSLTISYATLAAAANESDAEGNAISFRVEAVSTGVLTKNGVAVTPGGTLLLTGEDLVWTPASNATGTLNAFTVKAYDGTSASSTAIQVKVQVAAFASFPIIENFDGDNNASLTADNWLLTGNATATANALRLTQALNNQTGSAIYNMPFSSESGINVQFDYFIGGGSGADGMSFFLLNGSQSSPTAGALGGALGYVYHDFDPIPGASQAYMGIGFDTWGNFLNNLFFHDGLGSGLQPNRIGIRGPATVVNSTRTHDEYDYVVGSGVSYSVAGSRKVNLTLKGDGTVSMQISSDNGSTWNTVYNNLNFAASSAFSGYSTPATFKLGFSASTGGAHNEHRIDNLRVTIPVDLAVAFTSSPSGTQAIGATVAYVVTVTNNGPNPDSSAQFSYTVPSGISGVTWSYSIAGGGGSGSGSGSGSTISTTLNLPVGATATFTVSGTVDASAAGNTLTHTASATPSSAAGDPTLNNRTATVTTEISDVPVISGMAGSVAFQENSVNASAEVIDSSVTISDEENNYNGGNISLTYTSGGGNEDQLTIRNQGSGAGEIGFSGGTVTFGGVAIGTVPLSGAGSGLNGQSLVVTLNSNATVAATEALLENLAYRNSSDTPTASRTISVKVNDGVGGDSLPHSIVITVNAQNDAPALSTVSLLTGGTEDTAFTITFNALASAGDESDPEGSTLSFRVESVSSGVLTKGGVAVTPGVTILATSESLSWTPDANANGTLQAFAVRAYDGTDVSSTAIPVEVSVAAVNDVPSFTKGANQNVLEDAGVQTITGWATGMSVGPANEAGQTLSFQLSNDNNGLFSAQPSIGADGTLSYTPAANANGSATVTVSIKDDGGTANSGSDTSASQTFTISVTAVNDTPSFTKGADQSVLEDAGAQTVTGWATSVSAGPANESAQSVSFEVGNDNNALFSTQPAISAAGTLTYTPAANANGTATVTVVIKDNGGTDNGGSDTSASQTFTISVTAVNDVPSFTKGANQNVLEDAGVQTITGWATGMSVGPANEAGQTLSFQLSNDNNGLFSAQPSIGADGTLSYTPAANANGSATVTVSIKDDGGTANSGSDTSASQTFTISVTPVNDAPTLGVINDQTVLEDASTQSVILGGIGTGANNESQTLSVSATSSDLTLIPHPVVAYSSPSDTATLSFQPLANANGVVTITVTVADDGGVANGGVQQSTRTFTISVTPVNDAPTLAAIANPAAILEDTSQQTVSFTGVTTGQPNETQTLSIVATSSNPVLIPNPSIQYTSPQGQGTLTYTPVPDANGTATITVIVSDDGGTADGGVHAVTNTFDVVVIPVNDVPTLNVISNLTMTEDGNPHGVHLLDVTAGGGENQVLTVSVFASNRELFSEVELDYASPNASGTVTLYPALNAFGTSTIFVTVRDDGDRSNGGENTLTRSFEVTMKPVNDAPTLLRVKTLEGAIEDRSFSITYDDLLRASETSDIENDPLQFRIESVNNGTVSLQGLAVTPGQTLLASGSQLVWTPSQNTNGVIQAFTIRVWDGQAQSQSEAPVSIAVAAVNDAPIISNLAESVTINEDTPAMIDLMLSDVDTPASKLQLLVFSSNTNLVPDSSILASNNEGNAKIIAIPAANQFGEVRLAVSVSDQEGLTATNSVVVTVNPVNDAPVLTSIGTLTNAFSGLPFEVAYDSILSVTEVSDVEGDPISFRLEEVYIGTLTNELRRVGLASLLSTNQTWTWFTETNGVLKAFAVRAFDGKDLSLDGLPISIDIKPTLFADAKLVASDGITKDLFGYAVAVDNGTIALGAPQAAVLGKSGAGAAYVFRRNGTNWLERSKLVSSDAREFDRFGSSIAISGNFLVAGAHQAQVLGQEAAGAAYVFARSGTNWVQRAKLVASDAIEFDRFGSAVAISDDTIVVGAPQAIIDGQEAAGAAYVFTRNGANWTEAAKLVPSKSVLQDWFGLSVAISGDTIVVGALLEDLPNKRDAGAVYVFQRSGTNWIEQTRLIASDAQQLARFGSSVAISGNKLVVGASLADSTSAIDSGAAYVFVRDGGQWKEEAKLVSFYEEADEWFGSSVSISTNTITVGSIQSKVGRKTFAGSAYKFVWDGATWTPRARLMALDLESGDRYGSSVAVSGEICVISTFMSDPAAKVDAGAAYVFSAGAPPDAVEDITVTELEPPTPDPVQASATRQINVATRLAGEASCVVSANYLPGEGYRVVISGPIGERVRLLCSEDFRRWTVLKVFTLGPFPSEYLDARPFRDAGRYYKIIQEPDSQSSGELKQIGSGAREQRDKPATARE